MGHVIDITGRLRASKGSSSNELIHGEGLANSVVDIGVLRQRLIQEDRRRVRRTILTEFISVHVVVPGQGLLRVMLYDVTPSGLSFDLESNQGHYSVGNDVELRVYLNYQTYFKIDSRVVHITDMAGEGVVRHGCEFAGESINSEALEHFVHFLESVTASLRRDGGDILISKINS